MRQIHKNMKTKNCFFYLLLAVFGIVFFFLFIELFFQAQYFIKNKHIFFRKNFHDQRELFMYHPYLLGVGRPNARTISEAGTIFTHNSKGFRTQEFLNEKGKGVCRVITLGGSSTYGTGVSDEYTWPVYLQHFLGKGYEVINMGIPAYSSVEHIIQTAFEVNDFKPDICMYYLGWNDARTMHVKNLSADYSNIHAATVLDTLYIFRLKHWEKSLFMRWLIKEVNRYFLAVDLTATYEHKKSQDMGLIDARALELYKRNIRSLIALCRARGITPIMVPQLLNYSVLKANTPYGWLPYVNDRDLKEVMRVYNDTLRQVCEEEKVYFAQEVLDEVFTADDFCDEGHFSVKGNEKFARILARYMAGKFEKSGTNNAQ